MTSREFVRSFTAKSLVFIYATSAYSFIPFVSAQASTESSKSVKKSKHTSHSHKKATTKGTDLGIDDLTLGVINKGDWQAVADHLESTGSGRLAAAPADTWLAFAYMYMYKCDQLKKMETRFNILDVADETAKNSSKINVNEVIVKAYTQMCLQNFAGADKTLAPLRGNYANDPNVSFALAAVAGKLGRIAEAIEFTQKTIALAPDFAWGYRTLGMLNHRFTKDDAKAETAFEKGLEIEPDSKEMLDTLVDIRLAHNNFDGAIDASEDAIANDRKAASNYYRLAQIYIQQWRLREALVELQNAIKLDSQDARFYRSRASIRRYQGDFLAAINDEKNAVEYAKDKPFELGELASMNLLAGHKQEAILNLQAALKVDPKNKQIRDRLVTLMVEANRNDDLVDLYRQALVSEPKNPVLHMGLGKALGRAGKYSEAIAEYVQASNLNPTDPQPHRDLGALHISQGEYTRAAKEFKAALNINPTSVQDLASLGFCYAKDDDYLEAEAAYVTALALQQLTQANGPVVGPTRLQINRSLASLLFAEGRYSDAAAQLEAICSTSKNTPEFAIDNLMLAQAKALRDLNVESSKALCDIYGQLSPEQQAQSEAAVIATLLDANKCTIESHAAAIDPKDVAANLNVAKAHRLRGELDKAETSASALLERKDLTVSQRSEILEELAQIALAKDDLTKCEELAKRAYSEYEKNYAAYETLGRAAMKKSDYHEAISCANKSIGINPYFTRAYLLLGDAQTSSGDLKNAVINYRKATELYPGLLKAHKSLLQVLQKLNLRDEAHREEEQIAQMEKQQ